MKEKLLVYNLFFKKVNIEIFNIIKYEYFEDEVNRNIVKNLIKYVNLNKKQPTLKEFVLFTDDKDINFYIEYFRNYNEEDILNDRLFYSKLKDFIKSKVYEDVFYTLTELYEDSKNNYNDIEKSISFLEKVDKFEIEKEENKNITYTPNFLDRLKSYEYIEPLETGFEIIDKYFGGGLEKKRLTTIVAPTHTGKTSTMIGICKSMMLNGLNGIFFSLEETKENISIKLDASFLGIKITDFKNMEKNELALLWNTKNLDKLKFGFLDIVEYGYDRVYIEDIKDYIENIEKNNNIKIDYIIIDYLGKIKAKNNRDKYEAIGEISQDLHGLAKDNDIIVLTAMQTNRTAFNNLNKGLDSVADSFKVATDSDNIILLLADEKMKKDNLQLWKIVKNRQTGNLSNIIVKVDFLNLDFKEVSKDDEELEKLNIDLINDLPI